MKLIDEKEIEESVAKYCALNHGKNALDLESYMTRKDFGCGVEFAEQKLLPMMIEFAEWVARSYTLSRYGEWCSLGMPTTNTTEQLLEQFLKTKQNETGNKTP